MNSPNEGWIWVQKSVLLAVHNEQLAEHGGIQGVRDENLFDSALDRPLNKAAYAHPDVADLAAAYGYGITRNHPFLDGNKRTALVAIELFLALNGWHLAADDQACLTTILSLADGSLSEADLVDWLRANIARTR